MWKWLRLQQQRNLLHTRPYRPYRPYRAYWSCRRPNGADRANWTDRANWFARL